MKAHFIWRTCSKETTWVSRCSLQDNIKIDLSNTEYDNVDEKFPDLEQLLTTY
jgi:hypothetical protein